MMRISKNIFNLLWIFSFLISFFSMASPSYAAEVTTVKNWDELSQALKENKNNIEVTDKLTAKSNLSIDKDTKINFNNNAVDMERREFTIGQNVSKVDIENFVFSGSDRSSYLFNSRGTAVTTFSGNLKSLNTNKAPLINTSNGKVIMDGIKANMDSIDNAVSPMIQANKLSILNGSYLVSNAQKFYSNPSDGGEVLISGGSKVRTDAMQGGTNGQIWQFDKQASITIDGQETRLELNGNGTQRADYGALFVIGADNSNMNVTNGAEWTINSEKCSGMILESKGGTCNINGGSKLNINQESDNGYNLGAAMRFRLRGDMTFNVKNKSQININKNNGVAPAIRMYGGNNTINVSGASDFKVKNNNSSGSNRNSNEAIQFQAGDNNIFNIDGDSSNVELISKSGPAINANTNTVNINAGPKTYFLARGNTPANYGIFSNAGSAKPLKFKMEKVNYYDFQNIGKGNVLSTQGRDSSFESFDSDIDAWKIGTNVEKEPTNTWHQLTYSLMGRDFADIISASDNTFNKNWLGMNSYSRLSGNNQPASVDKLETPTDADKSIYARVFVPQGKYEDPRPAYTDEVKAKISVSKDSNNLFEAEAVTQTTNDYNNKDVQGTLKFKVPNDEFLSEKSQIKIISAVRSSNNTKAVINTPVKFVQAVRPPKKPKLDSDKYGKNVKNITGKAGKNLNVFLFKNNSDTGIIGRTDNDGKFNLDTSSQKFNKDDQIQIILQDNKGKATDVTNPPYTNSDVGNIQPQKIFTYHDADFIEGLKIPLSGELEWKDQFDQLDFGDQQISYKDQQIPAQQNIEGRMSVNDSRGKGSKWSLTVKAPAKFENSGRKLKANLVYQNNGNSQIISENEAMVAQHTTESNDETTVINQNWNNKNTGIFLDVPGNIDKYVGKYSTNVSWTLKNVPN